MEIQGKKAIIVGGASGMAKASAELLKAKGAEVAILDLPTSAGAEVAKELGGSFFPVNVMDDDETEAAIDGAVEALGGIHISREHRRRRHRQAHAHQGGPAPARRLPPRHRAQPDLLLQRQPAGRRAHEQERARGRRARRDHQHRVDRRVRGPDRPGRLHRRQGRHRRHVPDDGPRPRLASASGRWPSRRACSPPGSPRASPTSSRRRSPRTPPSRSAWAAPRSTASSPSPSSRTRCSTVSASASTPASASPRSSRSSRSLRKAPSKRQGEPYLRAAGNGRARQWCLVSAGLIVRTCPRPDER